MKKYILILNFISLFVSSKNFLNASSLKPVKTTTTMPVAKTTGLSSPLTTVGTLSSLATGNSFVFNNGTLTEYLDPSGIYIYSGTINQAAQIDYFVVMPDYLFKFLIQNINAAFPGYNQATGIIQIPGQKMLSTVTNPYDNHTQHINHAISLVTGNCYTFDAKKFSPGKTPATTAVFTQSGSFTLISNGTTTSKGPLVGIFSWYVPYPNFQGRLSQSLTNSIETAITNFTIKNTKTSASTTSLNKSKTAQPRFTSLSNTSLSTKTNPTTIYKLENITLTEILDQSGIYVYQGAWSTTTTNNAYAGTDYFIFTTPYLFSQINPEFPDYNYQNPTQPLLFPGQQLNQTYPSPVTQTTSPTSVLSTTNQIPTLAISLVTGNCYQLIQNNTAKIYSGSPAIAANTVNTNISLQPYTTNNFIDADFYNNYAPYQNFSGKLSSVFINLISNAIKALPLNVNTTNPATTIASKTANSSNAAASTLPNTPPTATINTGLNQIADNGNTDFNFTGNLTPSDTANTTTDNSNTTNNSSNTTTTDFGSDSLGASTFTPFQPTTTTSSFETTSFNNDNDDGDDDDDDDNSFQETTPPVSFENPSNVNYSDNQSTGLNGNQTFNNANYSQNAPSSSFNSTNSFNQPSSTIQQNNYGSLNQSTSSYQSIALPESTPVQPSSVLIESTTEKEEIEEEKTINSKNNYFNSGKGSPEPYN